MCRLTTNEAEADRQDSTEPRLRIRTGDGAVVVVRVERVPAGGPGRLTIEEHANTRGLALHTRRAGGPIEGHEVELVRTGLFGEEASTGLALLPDDRGAPVWLRAPERSDAGRILTGVVEGLAAPAPPTEVISPSDPSPRARVTRTAGWDGVGAPDGRPGGLPPGEPPTQAHRALGGAWTIALDAAPELPLEARLWHAHRMREPGGEVERLAATWQGPGAEDPWHTELHVAHHVDTGTTEFLVVDGSTDQAWTLADAVHTPGTPLTWRVHPAPLPDEASRAGEALYSLILAFAGALEG